MNTTLPTFFVIGAAKAGTTTLHDALARHPQVYVPYKKEPTFFASDDYDKGLAWYLHTYFNGAEQYPARGECSVGYLFWHEKTAGRIAKVYEGQAYPNIVAILRDPVARAYSAYWHLRHYGGETLSFEEALAAEDERFDRQKERLSAEGILRFAYFRGGCYDQQLRSFLDHFPPEQCLFLLTEDLQQDYTGTMRTLFAFLGVDTEVELAALASNAARQVRSRSFYQAIRQSSALKELVKPLLPQRLRYRLKQGLLNLNMKPAPYPPINPDTARELRARYLPHIEALEAMIGRDLSAWKSEPAAEDKEGVSDD
jgi:hypothetical protein